MKITEHEYNKAKAKLNKGKTIEQVLKSYPVGKAPSEHTLRRIKKSRTYADYKRICVSESHTSKNKLNNGVARKSVLKDQRGGGVAVKTFVNEASPKRKKFLGIF